MKNEIKNKFVPETFKWEPKNVIDFWNWMSESKYFQEIYFSRVLGDSILDEVEKRIKIKDHVLDLGSGPGYLVQKLISRKICTTAMDTSLISIQHVSTLFSENPNFIYGVVNGIDSIPVIDDTFQVILVIEMIEHLYEVTFRKMMHEVYRVLKPGGYVVITTPNDEHLESNTTICPNCGSIFHRMQHIKSFSHETLENAMSDCKFKTITCSPILFSRRKKIVRTLQILKYKFLQEKLPHLLYIGRK